MAPFMRPIPGAASAARAAAHGCGLSQSTVSAHLVTLQRAGLISSQKIGQWHFFKRNETTIQAFLEQLRQAL